MREIKFRAWNNETRSMYKWDELSRNPSSLYNALVGSVYGHDRLQMWSVMQSTSLKDKNGIEIYEGDILEWYHYSEGVQVSKVCYGNAEFLLAGMNTRPLSYFADVKVIGNIWEHPELLE